jgi:hypothetical protein
MHETSPVALPLAARLDLSAQSVKSWRWLRLSVQFGIEPCNGLTELILVLHADRNGFASVQHRSVMAAAEVFSNFMQGRLGVAPGQIHRHLARENHIGAAAFSGHVRWPNTKMFGHLLLNLVDSDWFFGLFP